MENGIKLRDDQALIIAPIGILELSPLVDLFGPLAVSAAVRAAICDGVQGSHVIYSQATSMEDLLNRVYATTDDVRAFCRQTGFSGPSEIPAALSEIWRCSTVKVRNGGRLIETAAFNELYDYVVLHDRYWKKSESDDYNRLEKNDCWMKANAYTSKLEAWTEGRSDILYAMGIRKPLGKFAAIRPYSSSVWYLKDLNDEVYLGARMRTYPHQIGDDTMNLLNDELPGLRHLLSTDRNFLMLGVVEIGCFETRRDDEGNPFYSDDYALNSSGNHLSTRFYVLLRSK